MKKYNSAKDMLIIAHLYKKAGRTVDAAKMAIKAMEEEDAEELFEALDAENDIETASEEGDELENITAEDLEVECDGEGEDEAEAEEVVEEKVEEELPPIEEAVAKVRMLKKKAMANKATLSGSRSVKARFAKKLLRRK